MIVFQVKKKFANVKKYLTNKRDMVSSVNTVYRNLPKFFWKLSLALKKMTKVNHTE